MKLLHVLAMDTPAGLENRVARLIASTNGSHEHSFVVCNDPVHPKYHALMEKAQEITHWKYWKGSLKIPSFLRPAKLKRWLRGRAFDGIFCHNQLSKPDLLDAVASHRAPAFYWDGGSTWFAPREARGHLNQFDRFISVSRASRVMLNRKFDRPTDEISVIPSGYPQQFSRGLDRLRSEGIRRDLPGIGRTREGFTLLFLGRLVAVKGANVLLRAMTDLPEEVHLLMVGDGKQRQSLEELSADLNVDHQVTFCGFRADPRAYLVAADLLVTPSAREPVGNVNLEGGLAELPVVSTHVDGIPEYIEDGETGVLMEPKIPVTHWRDDYEDPAFPDHVVEPSRNRLVEPRFPDPDELAEEIRRLRRNPTERKRLGNNLKDSIHREHNMTRVRERFESLVHATL